MDCTLYINPKQIRDIFVVNHGKEEKFIEVTEVRTSETRRSWFFSKPKVTECLSIGEPPFNFYTKNPDRIKEVLGGEPFLLLGMPRVLKEPNELWEPSYVKIKILDRTSPIFVVFRNGEDLEKLIEKLEETLRGGDFIKLADNNDYFVFI